jgi:hypothetical protein
MGWREQRKAVERGGELEAEVQRLRMGLDASLGDVKHRLEVRVCRGAAPSALSDVACAHELIPRAPEQHARCHADLHNVQWSLGLTEVVRACGFANRDERARQCTLRLTLISPVGSVPSRFCA